jgi:hypothetical protein
MMPAMVPRRVVYAVVLAAGCFPSFDGLSGGGGAPPDAGDGTDGGRDAPVAPDASADALAPDAGAACTLRPAVAAADPRLPNPEGGVLWDGGGPGFTCNANEALTLNGVGAQLDRDGPNLPASLDGRSVAACLAVDFAGPVRSARVVARSTDDSACYPARPACDAGVPCTGVPTRLLVFRKQTAGYAYTGRDVVLAYQAWSESEVDLGAPADGVVLCTPGGVDEKNPDPEIDLVTGCL